MGYLTRSAGIPNFSKAVISLWFRVPSASIAAAVAQYNAAGVTDINGDLSLPGVIPLITFGPNSETLHRYDAVTNAQTGSSPISPCVIGIACGELIFGNSGIQSPPVLYGRIQYSSGALTDPPSGPPVRYQTSAYNDFFQVGALMSPCHIGTFDTGLQIPVNPDVWHHVLVSFDMSGGCSTSPTGSSPALSFNSLCNFWWAFDDVNYNGRYLWPNTPEVQGATPVPNGIVSDLCLAYVANDGNPTSRSFAAGAIPTSGKPIGIPSSSGNVSKIYDVEMAYLQVFTGVTLDTSVEANRRAFVKANGTPETNYSIADGLLGKSPEIRLSSGRSWKAGTNTGSLGGTFTKTGTINLYTHAPLL